MSEAAKTVVSRSPWAILPDDSKLAAGFKVLMQMGALGIVTFMVWQVQIVVSLFITEASARLEQFITEWASIENQRVAIHAAAATRQEALIGREIHELTALIKERFPKQP